uniref:Uncharacterized protein n=1 Tax=viral metagenome TaxID=1070528 RepID=A0A6C0KWN3_9ZZZZ
MTSQSEQVSDISRAAYSIVKNMILYGCIFGGLIIVFLSLIVRDTQFIQDNPGKFGIELFLMSVLAALPLFYIGYSRDLSLSTTLISFLTLMVQCGIIHLLLQLSGFYTNLFAE